MRTPWPRLRAAWVTLTGTGAAASVAFGLLVFASVLASLAIPRESVGLRNAALQRTLAASPPGDRSVIGTLSEPAMSDGTGTQVLATDIAAVGAAVRARLAADGVPVAGDPPAWAGLTTGLVGVTGVAQTAGYAQPQLALTYRTGLARYSHVVAGRLPAGGSQAQADRPAVVQAAVTSATAARFGLRVGSRLNAGPVQLVVTAIIQPVNPASDFWRQEPETARPALQPAASPQRPNWNAAAFIGPGALPLIESAFGTGEMLVTWVYTAALSQLTAGQAGGAEASVADLVSSGVTTVIPGGTGTPVTVAVDSQVPSTLSLFLTAEDAAAPVLELLYVSLAVLGAVVVLLGARLVAQRRAAEFTLMRARGAALHQLGWLAFRAAAVIAAVAGAAAAALAIGLTPGDDDAVGWWLAGVTVAVTLAGPVLISVVPQRVAAPAAGRTRRRAAGRTPAARRIVIEAALVAAAIGGLVVLRNEGLTSASSGLYQSAAPVLIAIPVAVVMLRCYPPLVRLLARLSGLSRGVVAFVGLARATRTPPGTVLPSFALVLVLAMVAFPDMISTSVTRSQVAASWQQVGADAIIQAPPHAVLPPALRSRIASMPGVVSAVGMEVDDAFSQTGYQTPLVFVDPARYAAVVDQAPGTRFPVAALSPGGAAQAVGTVPALASDAAAQLVGTAPTTLDVGTGTVTIRLVGRIGRVPGVPGDDVVVLPAQASGPGPFAPNIMLVAGAGVDGARLSAAVSRALPAATVTLRAAALAALTTAPVLRGAQTALTQGLATAVGFGALVLLLSLLLTAQTREITLAAMATMGLRRWQAQLLLTAETLPPVVAAAIGGVACAWLLVPLVGPSLNLAAYAGTGSAIVVTPAVFPLAAAAAGLVLAALLVLGASAVITYYRGSARALRIAD